MDIEIICRIQIEPDEYFEHDQFKEDAELNAVLNPMFDIDEEKEKIKEKIIMQYVPGKIEMEDVVHFYYLDPKHTRLILRSVPPIDVLCPYVNFKALHIQFTGRAIVDVKNIFNDYVDKDVKEGGNEDRISESPNTGNIEL